MLLPSTLCTCRCITSLTSPPETGAPAKRFLISFHCSKGLNSRISPLAVTTNYQVCRGVVTTLFVFMFACLLLRNLVLFLLCSSCFRVYLFDILWRVLLRSSDFRFRVWSRGVPFEAGHRATLPSNDSGRGVGWSVGCEVWDVCEV